MNMEYEAVNNTVRIKDEKGNVREEKYTSNFKEKLECENVIESLEDIYNKIKEIIENDETPDSSFTFPICVGIGEIGLNLLFCNLANRNIISEDLFAELAFGSIPFLAMLMAGYVSKVYHTNQEALKIHCAYNRVSVMACKLWCDSMIELTKLKVATMDENATSTIIQRGRIDTTEQLEEYKRELEFYYQIALEEKRWMGYYRKDILELKAQEEEYDENQISLIRKYCQKFSQYL